MSKYTRDAFKSLDLLEDTDFELTDKDSFEELGDFIENEDGDVKDTTIVDLDAETEDEIKDSYVGDVILSCPVCRTNLFKATDEVTVEDEAELCCVGDSCPICGQEDGFKVIGKVAPFEEVKDEEETEVEVETEPDEAEVEVKEKVKESFRKRIYTKKLQEQAARRNKRILKESKKLTEAPITLDTGEAETTHKGQFDETITFEQWYDITKGENEKYRKSKYYPFDKYVKIFPEAEVLRNATAGDLVAHAHEFYDFYDVDSSDREEAFNFASDVTGKDYDVFYSAWVDRKPISESLVKLTEASSNVKTETIMKSDDGLFEFVKKTGTKKGEDDEEIPWVHFDVYSKGAAEKHVVRISLGIYGSNFDDPWYQYVEVNHGMRMRRDTFEDTEEYINVLTSALKFAKQIAQYLKDNGRMKKDTNESKKTSKGKKLVETPVYDLRPQYDSRDSFYGKAKVDTGDKNDKNKLYSYNTLVAEIKDGKPVVYGTYSQTTLRHIKDWLKQNGFKADNAKQIIADYGVKDESCKRVNEEMKVANKFLVTFDSEDELVAARERLENAGWDIGVDSTKDDFNDDTFYLEIYGNGSLNKDVATKLLSEIGALDFKVEECKQVNEEVSDLAYDMAEEIDKRFAEQKFISWDDFNEAFEDAYPGSIDWTDDKFNDLETDVRGILGYLGWETIYEGEDEGGLRMLESRRPAQKKPLTESKGDLQKLPQEVQDIVGEVFDYTMDFDFLDVVADILLRIDDFEEASEDIDVVQSEVDDGLIYTDDQWEVLRYYFDSPSDLDESSWDNAFSYFVSDIQKVCDEIVADKQIKADAEEMDAEDDDYDGEESLKKSGKTTVESVDDTSTKKPLSFDKFVDKYLRPKYEIGGKMKDGSKMTPEIAKKEYDEYLRKFNESLTEAIENATIETEDQVIKVSSEEKEEDMNADWYERESMGDGELLGDEAEDEMIVPLSDEDMEEIEEPAEEEETEETTEDDFVETDEEEMPEDEDEFDFEEVQEESFNRLVGKYLTNTYKNIDSFKVIGKDIKEGLVKINGEIEFKSGNKRNTTFIFEAKRDQSSISRKKMRFVGLNETFTDKKNAYVLNAKKVGKQMVAESLRYNYPAKAKNLTEELKVVKGLVK